MTSSEAIVDGLGSRNNTEIVHAWLRDHILRGELAPGTIISEAELARRFELSRGPVREALRMLQREGLVDGEKNRRSRVSPFSIEDLEGLYALRITNEAFALRASVPLFSQDDLRRLDRFLVEMKSLEDAGYEQWEWVHGQFHCYLNSYAGPRICDFLKELSEHASRYRRVYTHQPRAWTVGRKEHEEIVAACHERKADEASKLLARHLARTALTVLALRAPEREPVLVRAALNSVLGGASLTTGTPP